MPLVDGKVNLDNWWEPQEGVNKQLPANYSIRPLEKADFDRDRFVYMQAHADTYMPLVITNDHTKIVACGTLVVERKFIRSCGKLGHIEDIVVCDDQRGHGLGKVMLQQLKDLAIREGCYKVTLDCDVKNEIFYEKCGFETKGLQMVIYNRDGKAGEESLLKKL